MAGHTGQRQNEQLQGTATQRDRKALEGRMEALRRVYEDHKRAEKEKQMATRYHRVCNTFPKRSVKATLISPLQSIVLPNLEHKSSWLTKS